MSISFRFEQSATKPLVSGALNTICALAFLAADPYVNGLYDINEDLLNQEVELSEVAVLFMLFALYSFARLRVGIESTDGERGSTIAVTRPKSA
ncbi:MAG: hypothetical protein NBV63_02390 [Candidatus Pacebacteria bacterium]|nr:hypothetical protein [Candidatus Paceibacterota bacterium]